MQLFHISNFIVMIFDYLEFICIYKKWSEFDIEFNNLCSDYSIFSLLNLIQYYKMEYNSHDAFLTVPTFSKNPSMNGKVFLILR